MKWRYASFLIRFWQFGPGRQRVAVSHIQSGEQANPESLSAAFEWVADRAVAVGGDGDSEETPADSPSAPDGGTTPPAIS
jgi:hypothetical protein